MTRGGSNGGYVWGGWIALSLLLGESGLLSFGIFAFWHDGQSQLVLASEGSVLDGDGFKVVIGHVEGKGGYPE